MQLQWGTRGGERRYVPHRCTSSRAKRANAWFLVLPPSSNCCEILELCFFCLIRLVLERVSESKNESSITARLRCQETRFLLSRISLQFFRVIFKHLTIFSKCCVCSRHIRLAEGILAEKTTDPNSSRTAKFRTILFF